MTALFVVALVGFIGVFAYLAVKNLLTIEKKGG